ncbi:hypothetical protein ABID65_003406 [Bradyrhizobium sp. S3.9.2]|uniref:hypothetical protein n=1 Tax=Bradyrhizobium sp. S3.9.2 TaxID=3156432 RepID=UPI003393DF0E
MAMTLGRGCTFAILIEFDKNCVLFENWRNAAISRRIPPELCFTSGKRGNVESVRARADVLPLGPGRQSFIKVHLPVGRQVQFVPKRSALTQHPLPQTAHHELCPSRKV